MYLGLESIRAKLPTELVGEIFPSYSPKSETGTKFELRIPVATDIPPTIKLGAKQLSFTRAQIYDREYRVSVFDANGKSEESVRPQDISHFNSPDVCQRWFQVLY